MDTVFTSLGAAWLLLFFVFLVTWLVSEAFDYLSSVMVVWPVSFTVFSVVYFIYAKAPTIQWLPLVVMTSLWSLRIAVHTVRRLAKHYPYEDGRFEKQKRTWVERFDFRAFLFFQSLAVIALILSLPLVLGFRNPDFLWEPIQFAGMALWLFGWRGAMKADGQLARFKNDPKNKDRACRDGLWGLTRHPNYFFELLSFCGLALYATPAPYGWVAWVSPLTLYLTFAYYTGIERCEAQALRTRGDDYRRYQKEVSVFFPWRRFRLKGLIPAEN